MHPSEARELGVVEGLHADAEARHASATEAVQPLARQRLRIGLERDLRRVVQRAGLCARPDEAGHITGLEQRRRAAAEEEAVGLDAGRQAGANLPLESLDVASFETRIQQAAVEIAVRTNRLAERNVQVEPGWH